MDPSKERAEAPSWLNKDFIETVLRHGKNDDEISVVHVDVQNAVPKGDNYASIIMRVAVDYKSTSGKSNESHNCSLIVKSLPNGEFFQKWVKEIGAFARELYVYKETLPKLYTLLEGTGLEQERFATNVYVSKRPDTLILDDLRPLGYRMADRRKGMDLAHSVLTLRTLAKLHASSMVLHAEDPKAFESLDESFYIEENRLMLNRFFGDTITSLAAEVTSWAGFEHYGVKLQTVAATVVDRMIDLAKNKEGALKVLNHGDFWINNMLFRYENGEPVDLKMVDFQIVRFASPGLDIVYFLHTSPSQDIFENSWDLLVREYHESLTETLKCLGDERVVSLEDINREIKDKAFMGVVLSCAMSLVVADPADAPDFSALSGDDEGPKEASEEMKRACAGKAFQDIFQRRLPKFEEDGLI